LSVARQFANSTSMTPRHAAALALVVVVFVGFHPGLPQARCSAHNGLSIPCLELQPALSEIFVIDDCEPTPGLSCRIQYNGKKPLPGEVFFYDMDSSGRQPCKPTRLIYPQLKPGQTGRATFLDRCDTIPNYMVLKGK
jgi:hypothetical protein